MRKGYIRQLKTSARQILDDRHGVFAAVTLFVFLSNLFLNYILSSVFTGDGMFIFVLQLICSVLMNMIYYILLVGQQRMYLNLCRDEEYGFGDMLSSFMGHPEHIALYSVIQFALQTLFLNTGTYFLFRIWYMSALEILLVAAGFVVGAVFYEWIQLTLHLVMYLFVDQPYITAKDAILESFRMMKGNRWRLFLIELSFIGLNLLCVLSLGIGTLFVEPYRKVTTTLFYMDLYGERIPEHTDDSFTD